jgi:hypothetical protein
MSASHCFKVRLMWVSAHVGILGNEMVGGIAKGGTKSVLYSFTVAVGCNVYTEIKFRYLTGMLFLFLLVCSSWFLWLETNRRSFFVWFQIILEFESTWIHRKKCTMRCCSCVTDLFLLGKTTNHWSCTDQLLLMHCHEQLLVGYRPTIMPHHVIPTIGHTYDLVQAE